MPRPPSPIAQTVQAGPGENALVRRLGAQLHAVDQVPIWGVLVTAAAEVANVRTFTLQVVDRERRPVAVVAPVLFWFSSLDGGPPSAGQTLAVTAGTTLNTPIANQCLEVLTDATGKITVTATVVGAATKFVQACVRGYPTNPDGFAWT